MLLGYFLNHLEITAGVPVRTGTAFASAFHMRCLLLLLFKIDVGHIKYISGHILLAGLSSYTLAVESLTVFVKPTFMYVAVVCLQPKQLAQPP
jgi:hypothetical protein